MKPILEFSHVHIAGETPADTEAVSDISFSVGKGEFLSIIGAPDSGKSEILSAIIGLETPVRGALSFYNECNHAFTERIGLLRQNNGCFQWQISYRNVLFEHHISNHCQSKPCAHAYASSTENNETCCKERKAQNHSYIMNKRADLIRSLAQEPDILLLDEPFTGFDDTMKLLLYQDIKRMSKEENQTVILATTDLSAAVYVSDRILLLSKSPSTITADESIEWTNQDSYSKLFQEYYNKLWHLYFTK